MIRTFFLLGIICLGVQSSLFAQGIASDSSHHFRLALELGGGSIASYDNVGSPLPYSGITIPIGGEIQYVTPNVRHLLYAMGLVSFGNAAPLTDRYSGTGENRQTNYVFGNVRYAFIHSLTDIGRTGIHFGIGGALEGIAFVRDYNYGFGSSPSGELSVSAAMVTDFSYSLSTDHLLRATISVPLVAMVWRPAYGFIDGNTSLFSNPFETQVEPIGRMWSWRIDVDYDYVISRPFLLGLRYHELYYQYPMLAWRTIAAENELDLALTWRFDL